MRRIWAARPSRLLVAGFEDEAVTALIGGVAFAIGTEDEGGPVLAAGAGAFEAFVVDDFAGFDVAAFGKAAVGEDVVVAFVNHAGADPLGDSREVPDTVFFGHVAFAAGLYRQAGAAVAAHLDQN